MVTFKNFIVEVAYKDHRRCTAASCRAIADHFSVDHQLADGSNAPIHGNDAISHLKKIGLKVKVDHNFPFVGKTVKEFVAAHPKGAHFISTGGHAMALTDGKLTDTMNRGPNRRKITGHFEITK